MRISNTLQYTYDGEHGIACKCGKIIYFGQGELTPPVTIIKCPNCSHETEYVTPLNGEKVKTMEEIKMNNLYNKRMAICRALDVEEAEKESSDMLLNNWKNGNIKKASIMIHIDGNTSKIVLDNATAYRCLLDIRDKHTEVITKLENDLIDTTKHGKEEKE